MPPPVSAVWHLHSYAGGTATVGAGACGPRGTRKAALQGHVDAQYNLGLMCLGLGWGGASHLGFGTGVAWHEVAVGLGRKGM